MLKQKLALCPLQLKQLMIVGIDCYHDTAAGKRSIGALVASLNQSMSRCAHTVITDVSECSYCCLETKKCNLMQTHSSNDMKWPDREEWIGFFSSGCLSQYSLCFSRWFSKCVLQSRGQEIIDSLKEALHGTSSHWHP